MIKVAEIGNETQSFNPRTGGVTTLVNVIFTEEGRGGVNRGLSKSAEFLTNLTGIKSGLDIQRTHTQPVKPEEVANFPVGKEMPGFINRLLYSTPQMEQQNGIAPRDIDGKPTYIVTVLEADPKDDVDFRKDDNVLMAIAPGSFNTTLGSTRKIVTVHRQPAPWERVNQNYNATMNQMATNGNGSEGTGEELVDDEGKATTETSSLGGGTPAAAVKPATNRNRTNP